MIRRILFALLLLITAGGAPFGGAGWDVLPGHQTLLATEASQVSWTTAVVRVVSRSGGVVSVGTGTVIGSRQDSHGLVYVVLTARHNVKATTPTIVWRNGYSLKGAVFATSSEADDLCLISFRSHHAIAVLPVAEQLNGNDVHLVGYPYGRQWRQHNGAIISNGYARGDQSSMIYWVSGQSIQGESGGPVLQGGSVVGVISASDASQSVVVSLPVVHRFVGQYAGFCLPWCRPKPSIPPHCHPQRPLVVVPKYPDIQIPRTPSPPPMPAPPPAQVQPQPVHPQPAIPPGDLAEIKQLLQRIADCVCGWTWHHRPHPECKYPHLHWPWKWKGPPALPDPGNGDDGNGDGEDPDHPIRVTRGPPGPKGDKGEPGEISDAQLQKITSLLWERWQVYMEANADRYRGPAGKDGRHVVSAQVIGGSLHFGLSDGDTINVGPLCDDTPPIDIAAIVAQLPPVTLQIRDGDKVFTQSKPLGEPIRIVVTEVLNKP